MAKRGKVAMTDDNKKLAAFLASGTFTNLTWYMKQRLIKTGMVTVTKVKTAHKGRPADVLVVSGKGRGFIALASKWK